MAPSNAFYVWSAGGKPYRLMRPAAALQRVLQGHRLTVYDYPDDGHLRAPTPEDHTPFSATGWPVKSAFGVGHALDVMPRTDTPAGRAENAAIARQLIADRDAGVPGVLWIKYINWTDERGVCRQERWMPNHTTRSSTDRGHIHISGRSDCDDDARADDYDPLGGDDMDLDDSGPKAILPGASNRAVLRSMLGILISILTGQRRGDLITWSTTDVPDNLGPLLKSLSLGGVDVDLLAAKVADRFDTAAPLAERLDRIERQLTAVLAAAEANLSPAERASLERPGT